MTTALARLPVTEVVDYKTREAWLQARKSGVGASDSSALFGLNPWSSRFALWVDKATLTPPRQRTPEEQERLDWGQIHEEAIAARYRSVTRREIWSFSKYCIAQHPRLPFMLATPDAWILNAPDRPGEGTLQIKTSADPDAWDNGPPLYVQCQVQHELAVTGRQWGSVVVLIQGNRMKHWDLERNEEFIAELEEECRVFWEQVQCREPPPVDEHPATLDSLKRLHPLDNGETVELGAEVVAWLDEWKAARQAAKEAEARADGFEARIRAAIGPNTFGSLPGGRLISLKHQTTPARTQIVPEVTFRTLRELKPKGQAARRAPKATKGGR